MKNIAIRIIRAAVKTHGRAKVRAMLKEYRASKPDYQQAIEEAFLEFSLGGRK